MNKTKRKIFETSMKLFAEKGYDATSIEEITATVGVAKGTLYYHFSSKEEIFNFLVEEGVKLLQNSIDIKAEKYPKYIDKLKAIILIQFKIMSRYEDVITILLGQCWGNDTRNQTCKKYIYQYMDKIEGIVREGIEKGEIKKGNPAVISSQIYGLIASGLMCKLKNEGDFNLLEMYKEFEENLIQGLEEKGNE